MDHCEIVQPSILLAPFVKEYWLLSLDYTPEGRQRCMPANIMGLVFRRGGSINMCSNNVSMPTAYLFGQLKTYTDQIYTGNLDLITVVFQPLGAKAFFNLPIYELTESYISTEILHHNKDILILEERLNNTADNKECIKLIEAFLLNRIQRLDLYNYRRMSSVLKSVDDGEQDIKKLAEKACLGYKQFTRVFNEYIGSSPKDYLRIMRFQKTIKTIMKNPEIGITNLSDQIGYYDKSHLIKEIKEFSGYTPGDFISNSDPHSDYMSLFNSFFIQH